MLQRCTDADGDGGRRLARSVGLLPPDTAHEPLLRIVVTPPGVHRRRDDPAADWEGLSSAGHDLALGLARDLRGLPVDQVLSSPALHCRQTVMPLAMDRGLDVEPVPVLASGADVSVLAGMITAPEVPDAVLCVDRATLERLVAHLRHAPAGARLMSAWTDVGWVITLVPMHEGRGP
ncbi:histidine phosphatase family protein [Nocardioides sp. Soil805]|uniref:histidine phosphatase family protein n=1 Tax=Nocardioides sp. Soil805 TaxID=1736416 RepID=UPI0007025492|nr:histidine phosphatase family protein [Nocardioides sp. Soil805]KRF34141.1 hypothetical protein ASG94_15525 [Nocardioides sp. Soil805]